MDLKDFIDGTITKVVWTTPMRLELRRSLGGVQTSRCQIGVDVVTEQPDGVMSLRISVYGNGRFQNEVQMTYLANRCTIPAEWLAMRPKA